MQRVYSLIEALQDVQTNVLITGESGTGKELVADALHFGGRRAGGPQVKINCAALSETLIESELFGHVKGAFTGAVRDKTGRFEKADRGTIFLDEIGDISPGVQVRLLRVLEEREFERVGDSTPVSVDVRIVAATNNDLQEKVRLGTFRKDLYYRLKVMEISLPPLRERREDIPLLTDHFIRKLNEEFCREISTVSEDVMSLFMKYTWPGNVRELRHALEHAFIQCRQPVITVNVLPRDIRGSLPSGLSQLQCDVGYERQHILEALEQTRWNKTRTAKLLGVSRRTLYRWMEEHGIKGEGTQDIWAS